MKKIQLKRQMIEIDHRFMKFADYYGIQYAIKEEDREALEKAADYDPWIGDFF